MSKEEPLSDLNDSSVPLTSVIKRDLLANPRAISSTSVKVAGRYFTPYLRFSFEKALDADTG